MRHIIVRGHHGWPARADPPGVGEACEVVAELDSAGDRLTMAIVDMGACGLDARMAHTAFFELSGFSRVDPYEVSPRG